MNKKTRDALYPLVVAQQGGEYCVHCNRTILNLTRAGFKAELCIDLDDNSGNHSKKNLRQMQLLCHSCNTKKNHPALAEPYSRTASPEMIKGKIDEGNFRRWVLGHYMENENIGLTFDYLTNTGSEIVGNSQESCKRYLAKMTSSAGIYEWMSRSDGIFLVLKENSKS